jgi:hypothetical protein
MSRKHCLWETAAKKHLEYPPEPTSLRARNRPEIMPRRPEGPRRPSCEVGGAVRVKSESRNSEV